MSIPPTHSDVLACPPRPASVRLARRRTAHLLLTLGWHQAAVADAELTVTELTANAVRHVPEHPFTLHVTSDGEHALIEVTDRAPHRLPRLRTAHRMEDCTGRGLRLVSATAVRWGVTAQPATAEKTVWALLSHTTAGVIADTTPPRRRVRHPQVGVGSRHHTGRSAWLLAADALPSAHRGATHRHFPGRPAASPPEVTDIRRRPAPSGHPSAALRALQKVPSSR